MLSRHTSSRPSTDLSRLLIYSTRLPVVYRPPRAPTTGRTRFVQHGSSSSSLRVARPKKNAAGLSPRRIRHRWARLGQYVKVNPTERGHPILLKYFNFEPTLLFIYVVHFIVSPAWTLWIQINQTGVNPSRGMCFFPFRPGFAI